MNKTILMLAGLPGTGKSTLAAYLASEFDWVIIDKDLIHSALIEQGQKKDESGDAAYAVSLWLAKDLVVRQNRSVIFDSAGRQQFILPRLEAMCAESYARLKVIYCSAARAERQKRLAGRVALGSQLVQDVFSDEDETRFYRHLPDSRLQVDTTAGVQAVLSACFAYLKV